MLETITVGEAVTQALIFLVCAALGYGISRLFKAPENPMLWLLLVSAIFIVGYLPPLVRVVHVFGAPMQLNNLIWGVGIGLLAGFMFQRGRRQGGGAQG